MVLVVELLAVQVFAVELDLWDIVGELASPGKVCPLSVVITANILLSRPPVSLVG